MLGFEWLLLSNIWFFRLTHTSTCTLGLTLDDLLLFFHSFALWLQFAYSMHPKFIPTTILSLMS